MYLSYGTLGFLLIAAVGVWFWQDALRARDFANAAAMAACERIGLQFLDGTAAFTGIKLVRDRGRIRLRRTYVFDYTAQSIERRQGFAILLGTEVEYVGFAPEHTAQPAPPAVEQAPAHVEVEPSTRDDGDKVVDFETLRTRARRNRLQ